MIPVQKTCLYRPVSFPLSGIAETDRIKVSEPINLIFRVEDAGYSAFPSYDPKKMSRYYCESCYYASGSQGKVFRTTPDSEEAMQHGPTKEQREQMSDHTKQHQIIWAWTRQIGKE